MKSRIKATERNFIAAIQRGRKARKEKKEQDQAVLKIQSIQRGRLTRSNFYEKQVAVEAFEYVFSYPNCHPCDIFSQNSPFFCDRAVRKTWLNIFALAISNTLFLVGIMIAWAPILLRVFLGKH